MSTYKLTGKYETLLSSLSNEMSIKKNRRVSKKETLERILDVVIKEEGLFSSEEQPVSFFRRSIYKPISHTNQENSKSSQELITRINIISKR